MVTSVFAFGWILSSTLQELRANGLIHLSIGNDSPPHHNLSPLVDFIDDRASVMFDVLHEDLRFSSSCLLLRFIFLFLNVAAAAIDPLGLIANGPSKTWPAIFW